MSDMQPLTLSNVCEGKLDRQFRATYPGVLSDLKPGQKATVTFTVTIERPEGSSVMANITSKMAVKMPPSAAVAGLYSFDNDFVIKTEEPTKQGVIPFPAPVASK